MLEMRTICPAYPALLLRRLLPTGSAAPELSVYVVGLVLPLFRRRRVVFRELLAVVLPVFESAALPPLRRLLPIPTAPSDHRFDLHFNRSTCACAAAGAATSAFATIQQACGRSAATAFRISFALSTQHVQRTFNTHTARTTFTSDWGGRRTRPAHARARAQSSLPQRR